MGAFTATATPDVKADIENLLALRDPLRAATGFDRENLYFEVRQPSDKKAALLELVKSRPGKCGIVYCATRKAVEEVYTSCRQIASGSPAAFERLTCGLLLSGLAMQMMGNSRPASGAEHHISHIIEMEPETLGIHSSALHGEKVGVGTALASGVYHKLAETADITPLVKEYPPITDALIRESYGDRLFDSIAQENRTDCMAAVTPQLLAKQWPAIREIIAQIPTREELEALYREIGAKTTLEDIQVDPALLPKLLAYSPLVRNRMTLMRIRRMIDTED